MAPRRSHQAARCRPPNSGFDWELGCCSTVSANSARCPCAPTSSWCLRRSSGRSPSAPAVRRVPSQGQRRAEWSVTGGPRTDHRDPETARVRCGGGHVRRDQLCRVRRPGAAVSPEGQAEAPQAEQTLVDAMVEDSDKRQRVSLAARRHVVAMSRSRMASSRGGCALSLGSRARRVAACIKHTAKAHETSLWCLRETGGKAGRSPSAGARFRAVEARPKRSEGRRPLLQVLRAGCLRCWLGCRARP